MIASIAQLRNERARGSRLGIGIALLISTESIGGFAQPAGDLATRASEAPRNYGVELDVTAGSTKPKGGEGGALIVVGLGLERRLTEHFRVRGKLEVGGFRSFDRYSGVYDAARAGIEARTCVGVVICFDGGLDAAVIHMKESEQFNPNYMVEHTSPGAFIWGGIDAGGRVMRARLAFDYGIDRASDYAAGLVLGVALQW